MELGLALVNAQVIESMLTNLFAIAELEDGAQRGSHRVQSVMDTRYSQTFGRVLRDAISSLNLDPQLVDDLRAALSERNWLVHHSMREYYPAVENAAIRRGFYLKLKGMREEFERLYDILRVICFERMVVLGEDREEIEARIRRTTEEYALELLARDSAT